ncbi:MAG: large conductance mechanosensitive channel protein MscL [Thermoanaerobaculia bacterium]
MSMVQELKEFAAKGNAFDLAVGVVLGAAFGRIVTSLVDDVLMPPFGYLFGGVDFTNLFWTLGPGEYATLEAAKEAGAATINYGSFLQSIVSFLLVAFALFLLIRAMNRLRREKEEPAAAPAPAEDVVLLREIRDAIKAEKA